MESRGSLFLAGRTMYLRLRVLFQQVVLQPWIYALVFSSEYFLVWVILACLWIAAKVL